jgi:uncharacterized protein YlxW (UPF0749 family)
MKKTIKITKTELISAKERAHYYYVNKPFVYDGHNSEANVASSWMQAVVDELNSLGAEITLDLETKTRYTGSDNE